MLRSFPNSGLRPFSSVFNFMTCLGKLQLRVKFEVAIFIYHGNIRDRCKPKLGNPLFLEKLILTFDLQIQCFLSKVQLLWSYDCRKSRILRWTILNFGRLWWKLKIVWPKYQKAHTYAKSGRINRLACVPIAVFYVIRCGEKSTPECPLESRVVYNTASLERRCDTYFQMLGCESPTSVIVCSGSQHTA